MPVSPILRGQATYPFVRLNQAAAARREPGLGVAQVIDGARTVAVLEGVNDHENLGSIFRNAAGLGVDAVVVGAEPGAAKLTKAESLGVPILDEAGFAALLETGELNSP